MKEQIPEAVFWCVAVGLLAATVLLVRQRGITARLRRRNAELAEDLRTREEEVRHLVAVRLPALEDHGPQQQTPPGIGLLDARLAGSGFAKCLDHVLERFAGAVEHAQARADQSAKAALKSSMRSIQALANEQQVAISDMQDRHDRPDVLRDLLEIDHTNAQFGRRAQAIAVLCGSWPGRQRSTSAVIEVVRGATSRIRDYRRVQIHGQADIAVESRAVEPVVLTIAELLDNAARHSQPNTKVEVNVQSVHNGACVIIDDAGVGMDAHATDRAEALLSGRHAVDVTRLDDPPQFGFAVIGVLAARYGFSVSADTRSPYGGVRAVVFLPSALLTHRDPAEELPPVTVPPARGSARTPAASAPVTAPTSVAGAAPAGTAEAAPEPSPAVESAPGPAAVTPLPAEPATTTAGGLPKRRRRSPAQAPDEPVGGAQAAQAAPEPVEEPGVRSAEEAARRMGAFARGTLQGRADQAAEPDFPGTPHEDEGNIQG
ncbi:ATP-binding protein [Streptomyces sp. BV286]|uniref:ATP-binding protein n=1 Tax=Streptomyces sp. BV286 TaxID=2849672 RepID=UPI0020C65CC9|nr:ATP-binding protein [Streptomyces sp. BV286]